MARRIYGDDDLFRLKQSKPIPITAHTNELVVPVVYANMTQKWLKSKGVHLPLTHHQLAEMKKEAQSLAKGGRVQSVNQNVRIGEAKAKKPRKSLKKKKSKATIRQKGKLNQVVNQKLVIHLGEQRNAEGSILNPSFNPYDPKQKGKPSMVNAPNPPQNFPPQRPNYFSEIRPHSTAPALLSPPDSKEDEKKRQDQLQRDALDRYFKEAESRRNVVYDAIEEQRKRLPVEYQHPLRYGGNYDFGVDVYDRPIIEVIDEKEEAKKDPLIPPPILIPQSEWDEETPPPSPKTPPMLTPKQPELPRTPPPLADEEKEPRHILTFTDWVKASSIYDRGRKYGPASDPRQKQYMEFQRENYQRYLRNEPALPFKLKEESKEEEPKVERQTTEQAQAIYQGLLAKRQLLLTQWTEDRGGASTKKREVLSNNIRALFRDLQDYEGQPFYKSAEVNRKAFSHFRF